MVLSAIFSVNHDRFISKTQNALGADNYFDFLYNHVDIFLHVFPFNTGFTI